MAALNPGQFSNHYIELRPRADLDFRFGIFARADIAKNICILEEAPLCISLHNTEFNKCLAYEILTNSKKALFNNLRYYCCPDCSMSTTYKIWSSNALKYGEDEASILYNVASYFNHDCTPNALVDTSCPRHAGGHVKIITRRDIRAGEEVTVSFIRKPGTTSQRRKELKDKWNFTCSCQTCTSNTKLTAKMLREQDKAVMATNLATHLYGVDCLPSAFDLQRSQQMNGFIENLKVRIAAQSQAFLDDFQAAEKDSGKHWKEITPAKLLAFIEQVATYLRELFPNSISADFFKRTGDRAAMFNQKILTEEFLMEEAAANYEFVLEDAYMSGE
ncbi:SET domain-containing protein [Mollisia scopiformis]|uniref:SET domain-containing protein n=1 Tax=Mollisia scopiformis TaxID=149040 RepID=A0A132B9U0_MOLSC|nr:SET domain-containing protein [Mollisia scopiformis]KUJ09168.1 SET domain-containing protein [Mollisia scopiformis]